MEKALEILKELRKEYSNFLKSYEYMEIDEEYLEAEKRLLKVKKAIAELEEAMKPKTCDKCNLYLKQNNIKSCPIIQGYSFSYPEMPFYCSHYEQKD